MKLYEPFTPEYWGWLKQAPPPPSHVPGYAQKPALAEWDADVKMEAFKVLAPINSAEFQTIQGSAVIVYDLNVRFNEMCSKKVKHAVNSLTFGL